MFTDTIGMQQIKIIIVNNTIKKYWNLDKSTDGALNEAL